MAKKSEDSALGLEVRVEKGCMSKAEVEAKGGLEYSAERRCWVGRKIEETREAIKERADKNFITEWGVLSVVRFCYVFPCELRGPAWAVYSISQSAGGTSQNIIFKTM